MKKDSAPIEGEDDIEHISKSQLKREMHGLQDLAIKLTTLPEAQLARIPMPAQLEDAVRETKNIKKNEALRRHHQYLGKVMRKVDYEAVQAAVEQLEEEQNRLTRLLHVMEKWRDQLIEGDDQILSDFIDQYPTVDRQNLRHLVNSARHEKRTNKPPTSARKLFKFIRSQIAEQGQQQSSDSENEDGSH